MGLDLSTVFDASPNPYMIIDRDLRYVAANAAYCKAVARTHEELIGRRLLDLFPHDPARPDNDEARRLVESFRRVFETGEPDVLSLIHYRITIGGVARDRYWSATHTPLRGANGRVEHVLQHTVDVTDLQRDHRPNVESGVLDRARVVEERSSDLHEALLQAPVALVIMRGPRFVVEVINQRALDVWGRTRAQVIHKPLVDALPELEGQAILGVLDGVWRTGKPYIGNEVPVALERSGGREDVYFTFVYQPLVGHDDAIEGVIAVASDVTQNVLARQRVEATGAELEAIFAAFPEAIMSGNAGGITRLNKRAMEMLGITSLEEANAARTKVVTTLAPRTADTRAPLTPDEMPFARALRGLATHREILFSRPDNGADCYVYASGAPVAGARGNQGAVVTLVNITEEKRAEAQAVKLARVLDATRDFVGIATLDGRPTFVNAAGIALVGLPDLAAACAHQVVDYFIPADRQRVLEEVFPTALREDYWEGELTWQHFGTGELIPVHQAVFSLPDASGKVDAYATIARDLRIQKAAEAESARLLEQAELANRAKDQFLATVSHELRTPLAAIVGWVQMLRGGIVAPDKRDRALEIVDRNARAQAQLIDDLLDVSRSLAGKLVLEVEPVEITAVVAAAVETVRLSAEAKGVRLETSIESTAPLLGDPHRLQQVVWNLLSNAVKFTPQGGRVTLHVERRADRVDIAVTDTGRGIAPEFLPHVFEPFRQAENGTTRNNGGLGLGLAIVQHVVAAHRGQVSVQSAGVGQGARFVVSLPTAGAAGPLRARDAVTRIEAPSSLVGRRVLVVDDDDDTRGYIVTLLAEVGARVTSAASADEALALLPDERPDLVLSDIGMPGTDGYQLIHAIRELPAERGGRTPAIALTAFARTDDRSRAMRAGFQNHVAKPVDVGELFAVMAATLG